METTILAALVGAGAAIATMLLREIIQLIRERSQRSAESRRERAQRLRELYVDVVTAAIQATPARLQYRPSSGPPVLSHESADRMRARLAIEPLEDGDEILKAFIGVVNFSGLYEGEIESRSVDADRVPEKELRATEQQVRDNMTKLEDAARRRLEGLERR